MNLGRNIRLVDGMLKFWQRIPAPVWHNLEKAATLKKIFWHLNVDQVPGCYVEFGVALGHSMRSAEIAERTAYDNQLGIKRIRRRLVGFDTFDGFASATEFDSHPTWEGENFTIPIEHVRKRFKHDLDERIFLNKVDVCELGNNEDVDGNRFENYGISESIAVALFDMDLYEPTRSALDWIKDRLVQGAFLIFDEYFAFEGRSDRGECRALQEWLTSAPELTVRPYSTYGAGGQVFVLDRT